MSISNEAIEAACGAVASKYGEAMTGRDIEYIRTALEAAAPHIRAQAFQDATAAIRDDALAKPAK